MFNLFVEIYYSVLEIHEWFEIQQILVRDYISGYYSYTKDYFYNFMFTLVTELRRY